MFLSVFVYPVKCFFASFRMVKPPLKWGADREAVSVIPCLDVMSQLNTLTSQLKEAF